MQREVGPQLLVGVGVALFAQPLGPERDVPQLQVFGLGSALLTSERTEVLQVAFRSVEAAVAQVVEQAEHRVDAVGHLRRQTQGCEVFVAEQVRLLLAQLQDAFDAGAVVVLAFAGARDVGAVDRFAQVTALRVLEERHDAGNVQRDAPRSGLGGGVLPARFAGGLCGELPRALR